MAYLIRCYSYYIVRDNSQVLFIQCDFDHKPDKPKMLRRKTDNKQLLDEVEHDIMNYQSRGLCYLPKPKALIIHDIMRQPN